MKSGNRKFKLSYTYKGLKWFEQEAATFLEVYKNFWAMVQEKQLWRKSNKPVQIVDIYENIDGQWQPHPLSQYNDEQLGIKKESN